MKDIDDMRIGESFYLKRTVAVISTRTGKPCEFDEERIDVNALIIEELEKIKAEIEDMWIKSAKDLRTGEVIYENLCEHSEVLDILNKHISELKGEQK